MRADVVSVLLGLLLATSTPAPLEVVVEGIEGELRENVLAHLSIDDVEDESLSEFRIRRLHEQAGEQIRQALEPFGFYRPEIRADLARTEEGWRALYRVEPGPPVRVSELDLELIGPGADDPVLQMELATFPLERGDTLRHAAYELGKEELQNLAAARGYLDAELREHRIEVDPADGIARITLQLATGPRYRFGRVRFRGAELRDEVLERFVPFDPGAFYSTESLLRLQASLADSRYFRSVEVEAVPDSGGPREVPLVVELVPRPKATYSFGAGYGTDTGPRVTAGAEVRRLNPSGHRLEGELRGSFISRQATARYLIPVGDEAGEEVAFTTGYKDERFESTRGESLLAGASLARISGAWRQTFSLNLRQEWFEVGDDEGESTLLLPGLSLSRIRTNDPIFITHGNRLLIELRGAAEAIGSDVSFLQGKAGVKLVRSPHENGRFLGRIDIGLTATGNFRGLPTPFRFFAGGDRSVRGFDYGELGPRTAAGAAIGGRHLLTGSLSYEYFFAGNFGAANFVDVGNVFRDLSDLELEVGAGIGARYRSPIGLVRLDVASAVSRPGDPLRLHLVIGPDL